MSKIRVEPADRTSVIEVSDGRLILTVPIQIKRRGSQKQVTLSDGRVIKPGSRDRQITPMQQALIKGHRWLRMLEDRDICSLKEIARRESVDDSYVSRMINISQLEPNIISAILDGTLPSHLTLLELPVKPAVLWVEQQVLMKEASI